MIQLLPLTSTFHVLHQYHPHLLCKAQVTQEVSTAHDSNSGTTTG